MWASVRRAAARLRASLRPGDAEHDFADELEAHLEMAIDDKIRQGLAPREARRQARLELGNLTQLREAGRAERSLPWIGRSWLDVKLGLRMLRKSWGLTLVAGLAMTVVIGLAAVAFEVMTSFIATDPPLEEGDRIVAVQSWSVQRGTDRGASARDLERWRGRLRSLDDLGAFRTVERNLQGRTTADRPAETITVAEITATGFDLARVRPALGRTLEPADELEGADPVVVIGHDVWRTRFGGDSAVLGRRVRLDGTVHTIVGVMPEGFAFPIFHQYWTALRSPSVESSEAVADLFVFARLRDGATREQAQHELRALGRSVGTAASEGTVELRVVPYVAALTGALDGWMVSLLILLFPLVLVPPCINVAVLIYARTVSRQGEFAARYVLGASRADIVSQLFLEILVLSAGAALLALVAARVVLWQVLEDLRGRGEGVPFWMDVGLSARTVLFVAGLAAFAALLAGAVPALQATGRRMQAGLKSLGRQTHARLGLVWTGLIALQVAFSFALVPTAVEMTWGTLRAGLLGPGFAAEDYLTARLALNAEAGDAGRFADRTRALTERLLAEPGVVAVSWTAHVPGEEPWKRIEVETAHEDASASFGSGSLARVAAVDTAFLEVFDVRLLTGRRFVPRDFEDGGRAVLVNRSFAEMVLDAHGLDDGAGRSAGLLGRRIRGVALGTDGTDGTDPSTVAAEGTADAPWLEIVGVVADLQAHAGTQTIYRPTALRDTGPARFGATVSAAPSATLAVRVRTDPSAVAERLRELTWSLDPALRINHMRGLDEVYRQKAVGDYLGATALVVATLSVLLLSAAGIYALMAFTLGRRRKEIGIRLALGAGPWRLLVGVFGRALRPVALGALGGVVLALALGYLVPVEDLGGWSVPGVLPAATLFVLAIAALAILGPARRGLRVEPIDELREG